MRHWVITAAAIVVLCAVGCGKTSTMTVIIAPPKAGAAALVPVGRIYRIPSGSMEPTYPIGSKALVSPVTSSPAIGSVVVFHPPEGAEQEQCGPKPHTVKLGAEACSEPVPKEDTGVTFIKRIVAGPGDEIYISGGRAFRKPPGAEQFTEEPESYATKPCGSSPECDFPTPIKIPAGHWFMLGDNRGESDDSRFWGPVPIEWIVAAATPCPAPCER